MTTTATYNIGKTNIAWMPELPEHWKLCRGKNLFIEKSIKNFPNEPLLAASQKQGVVLKTMLDQKSMEAIENFETFKLVDVNDFVISLRSFEGGIEIAYYRGIISPVYNIFNFRNSEEYCYDFFKYLFKSRMFIQELNIYKKGIRDGQSINYTEFANIIFPIPPYIEQKQIANYLDTQSQKINHFIAKKQQFIALLKEQRQSVINEAVTKGINKKVKLKDSGIKWLGTIPEHWEVKRIKNISSVISKGTTPSTMGADTIENGNIRFLKAENLYTNEVSLFPEFFIDEKTDQMLFRSRLKENDILLVIAGATIGRIGIVKKECIPANTNQAVCFIRPDNIEPEFLLIWMQCSYFYNVLWFNANQSAQPNIAMGKISNFNVAYPPLSEQTQIVNHIKTETTTIDTAIAKTLKEIELIKEYKEAMIAEAVMGKVNFNKQ